MRALIALFATSIITAILMIQYPDVLIKPGSLSKEHEALNRDCMKCHVLTKGALPEKCTACHKLDRIGLTQVDGTPVSSNVNSKKTLFHKQLGNTDCAGCHVMHYTERARREPVKFQHDFLAANVREDCAACHSDKKPANELHAKAGNQCAACHNVSAWSPAKFNHSQFANARESCASCHQKQMPNDTIHTSIKDSCAVCHSTESWKPANYDHSRYFRFDGNHPSDCTLCHKTQGTFKVYTCYGCHEHNPSRIAAKHREEGINDFENCARCHRSGNEHEGGGESGEGDDDDN